MIIFCDEKASKIYLDHIDHHFDFMRFVIWNSHFQFQFRFFLWILFLIFDIINTECSLEIQTHYGSIFYEFRQLHSFLSISTILYDTFNYFLIPMFFCCCCCCCCFYLIFFANVKTLNCNFQRKNFNI